MLVIVLISDVGLNPVFVAKTTQNPHISEIINASEGLKAVLKIEVRVFNLRLLVYKTIQMIIVT